LRKALQKLQEQQGSIFRNARLQVEKPARCKSRIILLKTNILRLKLPALKNARY